MAMIDTFNRGVPARINREAELYQAWFGKSDFTPETTIDESSDINCGALCNELEYVRLVSNYFVQSFDLDVAEDEELEDLINAMIDLPRNNKGEVDAIYRKRFRFIAVQKSNTRRTTKHAIADAMSHFLDLDTIQVIEPFDTSNHYFQLRLEGVTTYEETLFLDSTVQGFLDQNYIGGPSIGQVISYVGDLVERIKAAGVDFDVLFIDQNSKTLSSAMVIGTVQYYLNAAATVRRVESTTLTCNATVV
jgi:hypothetical protein